jgi:hypothetical protein
LAVGCLWCGLENLEKISADQKPGDGKNFLFELVVIFFRVTGYWISAVCGADWKTLKRSLPIKNRAIARLLFDLVERFVRFTGYGLGGIEMTVTSDNCNGWFSIHLFNEDPAIVLQSSFSFHP